MDVQQLRRADERAGKPIHAGQTVEPRHEPLARFQNELHAVERHGLWDDSLLGEESYRAAENALSFSDHCSWEAIPTAELYIRTIDRRLLLSNG